MRQSYCDLDPGTLQKMKDVSPILVQEFRQNGKVTDQHMDSLGIPRMIGDEGKEHSDEVYWKGLATLITAEHTVSNYRDYVQEQRDKKDPVKILAAKQLAAAEKALKKYAKEDEQHQAKMANEGTSNSNPAMDDSSGDSGDDEEEAANSDEDSDNY